ncbi:MAG TPA: DUF1295 domain-containing protein [Candidatus Limnocylindria bacterium]|nr:DUF1295 domain-containing protein [Candidatus Limnocylindria bacterium]
MAHGTPVTPRSARGVIAAATRSAGPLLLMATLPPFVYWLWICLTFYDGVPVIPTSGAAARAMIARVPAPTTLAVLLYAVWWLVQVALALVLPGPVRAGTPLADGTRLAYRLNGWPAFWATLALAALAVAAGLPAAVGYEQFGALFTAANVFTLVFAAWLWSRGRRRGDARAPGSAVRDFFMGVSLNPRVRGFDLKFFCETRPGLMLWALITLSCAAAQWERHHAVSAAMVLVVAFQCLYVADCLYHEEAILTTWDIKHERFGWMLAWGSLVWVPFTYSLQAYYLVDHSPALSWPALAGLVALNTAGYAIFRGANLQKHRFRQDPARPVWRRPPRVLRTARGALLLTSGWWGLARHANYLGDLTMALAWCLTTGFRTPLTYFYVVYMIVLLVHRERRDHAACRAKYGEDWMAYCRQVRWRIVPGIY